MATQNIGNEIKRNLLGSLEVALFMPAARTRFGDTKEEAIRSFFVPVLLFPLTLIAVYLFPHEPIAHNSVNTIAILYGLRMAVMWLLFFGAIYWLTKEIAREKHFCQFVIASNWLAVPATIIFLPIGAMLLAGTHTWEEVYPFTILLIFYTYAFSAFMAGYVLRIPWELAGFIAIIGMAIDQNTLKILYWVGHSLPGTV